MKRPPPPPWKLTWQTSPKGRKSVASQDSLVAMKGHTMTPEEKKTLQDRIDAASDAEHRMRRLQEVLEKLRSGQCKRISLGFGTDIGGQLHWCENVGEPQSPTGTRWPAVCFSGNEDGLGADIFAAVCEVLKRRLAEAQKQLEDA